MDNTKKSLFTIFFIFFSLTLVFLYRQSHPNNFFSFKNNLEMKLQKIFNSDNSYSSNNICPEKISNLPKSIPKESNHLAKSGKEEKLPAGPTILPRPGPTLVIAVAALDILVIKSTPSRDRRKANKAYVNKNMKKKAKTVSEMLLEIGSPLYFGI